MKSPAPTDAVVKPRKPRHNRLSKIQRAERFTVGWFLLPSLIGMLTFYIVPFIVVIFYSFVDSPINKEFVFFENFTRILKNSAFQDACANTIRFSLTAVPLAVILSLLLAIVLERNIPYKSNLRTIFLSPMLVPVASIILIWQVVFHYNGVANEIIALFGAGPIDWLKSDYSQLVVVLLFVWKNVGYNMILFMAALSNIPRDVLEVATLEGASSWQIFYKIKLRYLSSSILFVTLMSLINSFKIFREVYLLTGKYPYDSLYLLQHFMNNNFLSLDYQKLSAAAVLMTIVMIVIIGVLFLADNKIEEDIEE
ncbi:MAG: sugar ABC transporter permease [Clostridia bacterium]|nr:sugar ABC transporter permease [Clostridia bacterium]